MQPRILKWPNQLSGKLMVGDDYKWALGYSQVMCLSIFLY